MHIRRLIATLVLAALLPVASAQAFDLEDALRDAQTRLEQDQQGNLQVAQNGGMSLSEAIDSVRRRTDGRIVSAETRVKGGREMHHIKVLTKDGKVKTFKIPGRKRGNG